MAQAQKPDFVFPRNGRVHLNRWGRRFSRLLAVEVCASAWVMLDTPRSEVAWEYWLPTPFVSFPFTSPPVRHRVPPSSERPMLLVLPFSGLRSDISSIPRILLYFRLRHSIVFPIFSPRLLSYSEWISESTAIKNMTRIKRKRRHSNNPGTVVF